VERIMAETLGSLCDKLIVVKLKQYHTEDPFKENSLLNQERQLTDEINEFIRNPPKNLTFPANKVYAIPKDLPNIMDGCLTLGKLVGMLCDINIDLWHQQEKVYHFEQIPANEKDGVIQILAMLNIQRTQCIEKIDQEFKRCIQR
jgi:hypothetical protein